MAGQAFKHPVDTPLTAGLRFAMELIAWVAGPWAVWVHVSPWAMPVALVVLVGLPAVFSMPGDKKTVLVVTPGPVRIGIEIVLHIVALIAPLMVWPAFASVFVMLIVMGSLIVGIPRFIWLARGAPIEENSAG